MGDETMLREFPPLRASGSRRGEQKHVVVSGRNPYRVLLGALNVMTGTVVRLVRERCRTADTAAHRPSSWAGCGPQYPSCSSGIMRRPIIPSSCSRRQRKRTSRLPSCRFELLS